MNTLLQAICIFLVGMSIGWLVGLSVSPVTLGVITSLLGIAGGIVTGLRSLTKDAASQKTDDSKKAKRIDARPAALLTVGIAVAATLGIIARTHRVFEPTPVKPPQQPQQTQQTQVADSQIPAYRHGVLFSVQESECNEIGAMAEHPNDEAFLDALRQSTAPWAKKLVENISDIETLRIVVRAICAE